MMRLAVRKLVEIMRGTNTAFPTDRLDLIAQALVHRAYARERGAEPSAETLATLAPAAKVLMDRSGLFVAKPKGEARAICAAHTFDDWSKAAVDILRIFVKHLPKDVGAKPGGVEVQAWSLANRPYSLIQTLAAYLLKSNSPAAGCMAPWVEQVRERANAIKGVELALLPDRDAWPKWKDGPADVMAQLFRATPFRDMLDIWAPVDIPRKALHSHVHGMARNGAGKTTLNEAVILSLLGEVGMVAFDTKGGMAERLIRHSGKPEQIIRIDATSADMRPVFNIAQAPKGARPDKVAKMIQFVLAGMAADFTPLQFSLLEMIAKMAAAIPDATIETFIKLSGSKDFVMKHLDLYPPDVKAWIGTQYQQRDIQGALVGVERKLWAIVSSEVLKALLCGRTNTLDLRALLDQRYLVIVTIDKNAVGADVNLICRLFWAAAAAAMWSRPLPLKSSLPDWGFFADEAMDTVGTADDSLVAEILSQGRERRVFLWLTHQQFAGQISRDLAEVLKVNSAVKFYANITREDATRLAPLMGCDAADMLNLPTGDGGYGYFALWVNGYIQNAARARVLFGYLQRRPKLDDRAYAAVLDQYRAYWAQVNEGATEPIEGEIIPPDGAARTGDATSEHIAMIEDQRDASRVMPWMGTGR